MKIQTIIYPLCMAALLGSCHIYKPYSRPEVDTQGLYRDPVSVNDTLVSDTVNMANLPWEKVFTDPQLQVLIRLGLERNTDLQTAMLQVKEAQASLMTSRLSYLPSLTLAPQGGVSSFDRMKGSWSWSLPVSASWELDLFGKILNTKRAAKAALLRSEAYRQAVQTQVVAAIANYYYTLLMLDKQLQITEETAVLWGENVETMKAMKEAAMVNEAGVVQSEANYYMVLASISDLKNQIRETENALSLLLRQAPQKIERGKLEDQQLPTCCFLSVDLHQRDLWMDQSSREHDHQSRKNDCLGYRFTDSTFILPGSEYCPLKDCQSPASRGDVKFRTSDIECRRRCQRCTESVSIG